MHRLPVFGQPALDDPSTFHCTHCGHCCTDTVVPVTAVDVLRIVRATGLRPEKIVSFYAPTAFMGGGAGLPFARLDVGPRVMGLAHGAGRVCKFHRDDRCTVYDARPIVCRTFPFSVSLGSDRLSMNECVDCRYERDGQTDLDETRRLCRRESRQDAAWRRVVDTWNDEWAGQSARSFLRFVRLGNVTPPIAPGS